MPGTDTDYPVPVPASQLSLADDTTGNVTSTKHGFAPKSPGDTTFDNAGSILTSD